MSISAHSYLSSAVSLICCSLTSPGYVYIIWQPDANELKEIHICLFKKACAFLFSTLCMHNAILFTTALSNDQILSCYRVTLFVQLKLPLCSLKRLIILSMFRFFLKITDFFFIFISSHCYS